MLKAMVRLFNERSDFTLARKPTATQIEENNQQYTAQASFLLARYLSEADAVDLVDASGLLMAVGRVTSIGVKPSSQLLQECFALSRAGQTPSTFVEVGAARPDFLSNTIVLQEHFGWSGLLVEPNPESVAALAVRVSPAVALAPVAAGSPGNIEFLVAGELSTALDMAPRDQASTTRTKALNDGQVIRVKRVPLEVLLQERFPTESELGFLSIDVEGAEDDVLASLDWDARKFRAIAVEHNFRRDFEAKCDSDMLDRGYRRVLKGLTGWDAWYAPAEER